MEYIDPQHEPGRPIGDSLERVAARLGVPTPNVLNVIFSNWQECVGRDIAVHATPTSLVEGALQVTVDESQWMTQLKWLGGQVSDRLNAALGGNFVERLDLRLKR